MMRSGWKVFLLSIVMTAAFLCAHEYLLIWQGHLTDPLAQFDFYTIYLPIAAIAGGVLGLLLYLIFFRRERREAASSPEEHESRAVNEGKRHEYLAVLTHELKIPLTAISHYSEILRSKEDMPTTRRLAAAGCIFSESRRLEVLPGRLRDIISNGRRDINVLPVSTALLIREVAAVMVPSLGGRVKLNVAWEKDSVIVESALFKTLLMNLAENAASASSPGQSVEISGRREDLGYAFYVRDRGCGLHPDEIDCMSAAFDFREGEGVGLPLCHLIARLHGTRLEFKSAPEEGTVVRIFLRGEVFLNS